MPTITAIESQKKSKQCVNLFVDGEFARGLALEVAMKKGLKKGRPMTDEELAGLIHDDQIWQAKEAALRLLDVRARAKSELRQRLWQKKFSGDVVEDVLADLEKSGLISDAAFAKMLVHDLSLKAVSTSVPGTAIPYAGFDRDPGAQGKNPSAGDRGPFPWHGQTRLCGAHGQGRPGRRRGRPDHRSPSPSGQSPGGRQPIAILERV